MRKATSTPATPHTVGRDAQRDLSNTHTRAAMKKLMEQHAQPRVKRHPQTSATEPIAPEATSSSRVSTLASAQTRTRGAARSVRRRFLTQEERRKESYRRAWESLEQGIGLGPCVILTLTTIRVRSDGTFGRDFDTEPTIRSEVWHLLWTRITRHWPEAQAFTVLEWAKRSGVHLHAVVRDAPGLTKPWMRAALAHRYPLIDLHLDTVYGGHGLARYLTKALSSAAPWAGWGRYTHPTSQSRWWLPSTAASASSDE